MLYNYVNCTEIRKYRRHSWF